MQYAVIKTNGKQYKISEGDLLTLDRLKLEGKSIVFEDILLLVSEDNVNIGKPTVNGARVEASLVEDKKSEKIRVMRFKAKSRYRKTIGFRAKQSVVRIEKISFNPEKSDKKVDKSTKTASKETQE